MLERRKNIQHHIISIIDELIDVFTSYGEAYWADVLSKCREELYSAYSENNRNKIRYVLYQLTQLYGGMSSLNDIIISQQCGHRIAPHQEQKVNAKILQLISELYDLLQREKRHYT